MKKQEQSKNYEAWRKIRGDWGSVKPFTRVENDKRRKKPKHIKREQEKYKED